ncbi:nitrate- and nitrite sensing domain-containing protein [Streptomyces sp. H10-C2]|uniref:sensor histidine kinase n=1 Tax=unclassified Streptomyces TaxID=2593676 RepID=UPI0024B88207|nr:MULTISPECIES: nitrate- and nitrite sensing domain-containing protein [unclassified Streptomyces]MDJ0341667.1 nitrate- and nitrite sensing domain-containing protein [Streptomyces sp. PH10-H1]MDJ0369025.1 nitrate- and nitrite sensing domain-containing protein [Streptomyces sp. H10-C2]
MRNTRRAEPGSAEGPRGNFTPPPRYDGAPDTAAVAAPETPAGSRSRFAVRNWRVATRLNAILLIPVLVALAMGGFTVQNSVQTWQQADAAKRTAILVRAAAGYSHALINERDVTVVPLLQGKRTDPAVTGAYAATDAAAETFNEAVRQMPSTEGLRRRVDGFRTVEPGLQKLRQAAYTRQLPDKQTEEAYVGIQHPLMELANELGLGTGNITSYGRTLYAISLAKAAESLTRSIGMHIQIEGQVPAKERKLQQTALTSYLYLQGIAIQEYQGGGTPADVQRLKDAQAAAQKKGEEQFTAAATEAAAAGAKLVPPPSMEKMVAEIASDKSAKELKAEGITPESWFGTTTLAFDAYRTVEQHLADTAVNDAETIASGAKTDAIVNAVIVVLALIIAFIVAGMMARNMSRSMRKLRNAAFDVAEQRLPGLVDQLSRTDPGRVDTTVQPIPITSHDEIGEVARAFDQVHREAVRLAAEQALLRGNVNAIFTNLSRRNQGLIQRQLTLITELENNEADPDQLENLFKMDHLATRMRRNGENLLVLAGEEPGRRWNQPVPLVDVLRAAASEVEAYERIELVGIPETEIHGTAVTDLVHLLAELLENATTFSSPQTKVRVTATRLPDGRVMVEIHDRGIGLTAEDFADINHKLADPPTVDVAISQRMGLFVVGRLADRHGVRVQLRPSGEQAGTTSLVMLPELITHGGGGEDQLPDDEPDFTVSRIVPEQPTAEFGYQPTAAELGFDDSKYQRSDESAFAAPGTGQLDPVGRSLLREERRAQLEASASDRQEDVPVYREEVPQQQGRQGYEPQYDGGYAEGQDYPGQDFTGQREYSGQDEYGQPAYQQQAPYEPEWQQDFAAQPAPSGPPAPPVLDDWVQPTAYQDRPGPESVPGTSFGAPESVGSPSLTEPGLPRRDRQWPQPDEAAAAPPAPQPDPEPEQAPEQDETDWRSQNDQHWQRAEQVREPKAGGVTPSGLPRRVPKANLVAGTAQQTPQGGPQVSRAPEDVRGRLSNLRRGVQQGRTAGTDTNGQAPDNHYGGPQNQER